MNYEYRNIDTEIELKKKAKRYWTEEGFTKEHMYLVLQEHGYSEWEADRAIDDYYQVYIQSKITLDRFVVFWVLIGIILLLINLISKILGKG
jgi:hypothetical protein